MSHMYRTSTSAVGIRLTPDKFARRIATFCASRNITDDASLATWATANITTVAQARAVMVELIQALTDFVPPGQS